MKNSEKTLDMIVNLCKNRGFIYPGSEIYGGLANSWDYGPLGVEFKNNVKKAWMKKFVQESPYNVGLDAAILMNPQTWVTTGHVSSFSDPLLDCRACKSRHRADKLISECEQGKGVDVDAMTFDEMDAFIASHDEVVCPVCGKHDFTPIRKFNLMFKTAIDVYKRQIKVMGCGVELGGKHNKELATFNIDNLRYNKIVICTDADVDGYQIRTLVLTMLYRLTPTLINEGYVYIAESPLYEITTKDHTYFAYTEPEKAAFLKEIGDKKYTIQRSKGLGENDPEMMWLTTMNPESRRLIKVLPTDVEETARVFDLLLGDNLAGRKEHIAQHGAEYLDDLDVS